MKDKRDCIFVSFLILMIFAVFLVSNGCQAKEGSLPQEFVRQLDDLQDIEFELLFRDNSPYEINLLYMSDGSRKDTISSLEKGYYWLILKDKSYVRIALGPKRMSEDTHVKSVKMKDNTVYVIVEEIQRPSMFDDFYYPTIAIAFDGVPKKIVVLDTGGLTFKSHGKDKVTKKSIKQKLARLDLRDGLLSVADYGRYGYISQEGELMIDFQYEDADDFIDGLAVVKRNGKYGMIDIKNNIIIECRYDKLEAFADGLANAQFEGKYGMIDRSGRAVIDFLYDNRIYFSKYSNILTNEYAEVSINGRYGLIDKTGKVLIECKYEKDFEVVYNGLILAKLNGKYGLLDVNGNAISDFAFDSISRFTDDGTAFINVKNLFGMINEKGEVVIEPIYDWIRWIEANSWEDRLQLIQSSTGCSGIADTKGNIIIPVEYSNDIEFYENGTARFVRRDPPDYHEKVFIIDKDGNIR